MKTAWKGMQENENHEKMLTGKSVYFKQCCSGVPAAVARTAYWLLGVVKRIKLVMSR